MPLAGAAPVYALTFVNGSTNPGFVYLYREGPGAGVRGVESLVWLVAGSNPGTRVRFSWSVGGEVTLAVSLVPVEAGLAAGTPAIAPRQIAFPPGMRTCVATLSASNAWSLAYASR
jgi:hypothetical protein